MLVRDEDKPTSSTPTHNFDDSGSSTVIVDDNHPTNEQQFTEMINNPPAGTKIAIEETATNETPIKETETITESEKAIIRRDYNETKKAIAAEKAARLAEDNAILDSMGLVDAYSEHKTVKKDILAKSTRTGKWIDIGDDLSCMDEYGSTGPLDYTIVDSSSGVRVVDDNGISRPAVMVNGSWSPSAYDESALEPITNEGTTYEPFKMDVPVTDNYGKQTNKEAWVLDYDTPIIYEPGGGQYDLAVGPTGKKLDLWGGYDSKRGVFVVTSSGSYGPDVDTLGEVMLGRGDLRTPEMDLKFLYGENRIDEFAGRAGNSTSKMPDNILVGGSANTGPITPNTDMFGQKETDMFYFDPKLTTKLNWAGKNVDVDTLSMGLFNFAEGVNKGADSLANMLPEGHIRNIGGAGIKTVTGIPTGIIMAGAAGAMLTEIGAQQPRALVDTVKGTPGFMAEQKKQDYNTNFEAAATSDLINIGLIGYGGLKMSGVKTPSIKLGDLNVKTSSGKASSVKGNVIDNVFKGKPVKTVFDDNVILDHAPTVGESAAAGEIITGGSTRIRSVSKMDVHNYWSKLTEIKPDSTDGPASSLSMAPKRSTPTRLETMFEVGKMATREMRVKRDATKYWGKLGNLETDPVKFTGGDLTGLKPNTKSNMLGMELDKGVFDYSRIYPNTAEPSMFKGAMLEGYLKNSRTRLGDVLSRQELIYETRIKPASVKPARTTLNSEAIFRIHSPRVLPSTGALYTIPKNTPKALSFDMQTVILPPAVKSSTKTFDVLTPKVSTSTRIKPNQTIDYGFARMTGLTTGSMVAQRALPRPRYFNVLGGSGRGSSRRNKFEARHDWINAGIFDVDMDFGLAPKKRKRRGRKQ